MSIGGLSVIISLVCLNTILLAVPLALYIFSILLWHKSVRITCSYDARMYWVVSRALLCGL